VKTTVVHWDDRPDDPAAWTYIGRSIGDGYFGNPWIVGVDGDRVEVLRYYRSTFINRMRTDREFRARIEALCGRVLVCHCAPSACHGDVIAEWLNGSGSCR
jgi:hypothetical protein